MPTPDLEPVTQPPPPLHPAIRSWREKRDQWIGSPLSGDCDALAAALEAEVKARREAEAALRTIAQVPELDHWAGKIARDALERR